ncbi:DUF2889 domain-containing protein [Desulfospira joergensenii]|uniref:DUF2889 domain-containing protein n=1 Tax=Desulfospira joergensenii TaxID=53329 RepID=UPI0003B7B636|nr:DUF2889 domain-containing protein [Desulfospira joergensenii]
MLKELIQNKEQIHTRQLSLSTYPHEDDMILVHGELKDRRHVPIFDILGRPKGPGVIHHITLTLAVAPAPLRIVDAEAEMITVPMEECRSCLDRVEELKGLEVKSGFSNRVREIMGNTKGCTHLCGLTTVMAQEIVHGWLTQKRKKEIALPSSMEELQGKNFLVDSCRIWKKDGIRMKQLTRAFQDKSNS